MFGILRNFNVIKGFLLKIKNKLQLYVILNKIIYYMLEVKVVLCMHLNIKQAT